MASDLTQYEKDVEAYFGALPTEAFHAVSCCICSSFQESVLLFNKGTQELRRCKECGLVWNAWQTKEPYLSQFYERSRALERWSEIKDSENEKERQQNKFLPAARYLAGRGVRSVLDVGCGNGVFLSILREFTPHIDLTGTELSPVARAACEKRGIRCEPWGLEEALDKNPKTYDAITLWGVLEHVKGPIGLLRSAHSRLSPNGLLVVCVPNVASMAVIALWEKCFTFCPQHLWHFDYSTLARVFSQTGFDPIHFWTIEPERLPVTKRMAGLSPYGDIPEWAYAHVLGQAPSESQILKNGHGYKIVAIAQSAPPQRVA